MVPVRRLPLQLRTALAHGKRLHRLHQRLAATVAACIAMMLLVGFAGTETALRARAAPLLRNE